MPPSTGYARRLAQVDALRGLAASQVLVQHYIPEYGDLFGWPSRPPILHLSAPSVGVATFFVISGFVISMTLDRSRSAMDFAVSRFGRIFPSFWAACLLTAGVVAATGFNPFGLDLAGTVSSPTMLNGLTGLPYIDPSYWTLTRELLFYVLIGSLYFACGRRHFRWAVVGWLAATVLYNLSVADGYYWSCVTAASCGAILLNSLYSYLFVAGVALYELHRGDRSAATVVMLAGAIAAAGLSEWPTTHAMQWSIVLKTALYVSVVALCAWGRLRVLEMRWLLFLGLISYPLYLTHQVIGLLLIKTALGTGLGPEVAVGLAAAAAVAIASVVHFAVEAPAQNYLRDAWRHRRSRQADAAGERVV